MYRDGYLLKCGSYGYDPSQIFFCVFEDGKVSFYTEKGGKFAGELPLAGHVTKVRVEKAVPGKPPNRFSVSTAQVLRVEGRKMKLGETRMFEFAAPSHDLMKEWANSLHLWRRMNWKENVKFFDSSGELSHGEERECLQLQLKTLHEAKNRRSYMPGGQVRKYRYPMISKLYSHTSPSVKKLREIIRHTSNSDPCATTT